MSKKKWLVAGGAVLAFGAVLSLFEDKPDRATAEAKPVASASATVRPTSPAPVPSPDQAQTAALVAALRAVDPGLVTKEDRAVSRAREVCSDAREGKDPATVQRNAQSRFQGGSVASLTDDQAGQIVTAVKTSFCG